MSEAFSDWFNTGNPVCMDRSTGAMIQSIPEVGLCACFVVRSLRQPRLGVTLNAKQLKAKRQARAAGDENPPTKPVMQLTAGVVVLLLMASATYHTLTYLP